MKLDIAKLNETKAHLVAAWMNLLPMEAPVEATSPNENMKYAKEQLMNAIANVECLRVRAGGNRQQFEIGDQVLIVANIEQGVTGRIRSRVSHDLWKIDYWTSRWVNLAWWQIVNLSR